MARLLSTLPVGAKVVDKGTKYNGNPITWLVGGHNHYAQGQTALVSEKIITLKPFDAIEASNTDSNRRTNGNNRYSVSNIRQWLNSDKVSWYSPQHSADAPPNNANVWSAVNDYDTEAGFLTNFSKGMRSALVATPLTTAKNNVTDGGGSEVVNDKVFLLSNTEVGLANENSIAEGKLLPLFSNDASRVAYPTAEAVAKSEYKDETNLVASKPWNYWLRSPYASYSEVARGVYVSGGLYSRYAYVGDKGARPAINLSSDVLVSDTPNGNGEYELILSNLEIKLLSDLPVGSKVVSKGTKYNDKPITWIVGGHNHYAQGQSVLVSEKIITLKAFDAKEASNADNNRKSYGSNRYSVSNIRQWLNSDKTSWYSPQHSADASPSSDNVWSGYNEYGTEAGFLTNFSTGMRKSLVPISLTTVKSSVTDGGGSEVVSDRVFLLSRTEVGSANEGNIAEGKLLPLFNSDTSRMAYPTAEAVSKSKYNDASLTPTNTWNYWLRSPNATGSYTVRYVYPSGAIYDYYPYNGNYGVRPAINLLSDVVVSSTPGADGAYEIINVSISPANGTNLGVFSTPNEALRYTVVTDAVGITVTEKFNGVPIDTKTVSNEGSYTVNIPNSLWDTAKYGAFRDNSGSMNIVSLEVSTGQVYTYPISKVLPPNAKTEEVVKAVNDMSNTAMPSHKKNLVDAIGDKATVGGTGTLGDIVKAIQGINLQSLGGVPRSVQSISRGSATMSFPDENGATTSEKFIAINTSALSFKPNIIVVKATHASLPTIWMDEGVYNGATATVGLSRYFYKVPYNSSVMFLPVSASSENSQLYKVYIYGG